MQIYMMEIGRGSNRKNTSEINKQFLFISLVLNGLDLNVSLLILAPFQFFLKPLSRLK